MVTRGYHGALQRLAAENVRRVARVEAVACGRAGARLPESVQRRRASPEDSARGLRAGQGVLREACGGARLLPENARSLREAERRGAQSASGLAEGVEARLHVLFGGEYVVDGCPAERAPAQQALLRLLRRLPEDAEAPRLHAPEYALRRGGLGRGSGREEGAEPGPEAPQAAGGGAGASEEVGERLGCAGGAEEAGGLGRECACGEEAAERLRAEEAGASVLLHVLEVARDVRLVFFCDLVVLEV